MLGRDETQRSPGVSHCAAVRGRRACVADQTRRRRCRHPLGPRTVSLTLCLSLTSPHLTSATSPARVRPAQSVKRISGHIR